MKNIEIEVRGPLSENEFTKLRKFFDKNAEFIKEKNRISFLYFRGDKIPDDVNEIKDDKVDLRVRITNKKAEIMLKYGEWAGSDIRKEIPLPFDINRFDDVIEFLRILGWKVGIIYATKTYVYKYKNKYELYYIEWSYQESNLEFVHVKDMFYH